MDVNDDALEEIIVSRNNEVYNPCSKYIGLEVAIGTLDDDYFASELESLALNEDLLWQRHATGGVNMDGTSEYIFSSQFLNQAFERFNNLYHKTGLLFQEDLDYYEIDGRYGIDIDRYSESTDNWIFEPCDPVKYSEINIPKEGNIILSMRLQDFHFKARGYFNKSFKKLPEINEIYNPITKEEEKITDQKFLVIAEVDWLYEGNLLNPFSLLTDVKLEIGKDKYLNIPKDLDGDPLGYFSVHIIFKNGEVIGCLTTRNETFDTDTSFPFASLSKYFTNEKLYCISPCPKENVKASSWEDTNEYEKMQYFIYQDKKNGDSRHYGIPVDEREDKYSASIKELVSALRATDS